jgi:hypothetical protein
MLNCYPAPKGANRGAGQYRLGKAGDRVGYQRGIIGHRDVTHVRQVDRLGVLDALHHRFAVAAPRQHEVSLRKRQQDRTADLLEASGSAVLAPPRDEPLEARAPGGPDHDVREVPGPHPLGVREVVPQHQPAQTAPTRNALGCSGDYSGRRAKDAVHPFQPPPFGAALPPSASGGDRHHRPHAAPGRELERNPGAERAPG